jgi:hypothetical protein
MTFQAPQLNTIQETSKPLTAEAAQKNQLVGTWHTEVALRNCATGASIKTLKAVNTFDGDGGLIEPCGNATPRLYSPGQGTWRRIAGHNYAAVLRFFRFNRDGSIAETYQVTRRLRLSNDGERFTGTAYVEVFDADNNLILAHCATESAKRFST